MILSCDKKCIHEFQDEKYGKGMRVHNPCGKSASVGQQNYRCTVCANVRSGPSVKEKVQE